jgi:hypothetical protein
LDESFATSTNFFASHHAITTLYSDLAAADALSRGMSLPPDCRFLPHCHLISGKFLPKTAKKADSCRFYPKALPNTPDR